MIDHSAPFVAAASMAEAIAKSRTTIVRRASDLLSESESHKPRADVLPDVAGLLGATLEELKVAEEELRHQNERFSTRHADAMRAEIRAAEMFQQLPLPALLTDARSTMLACNQAAAELLGQPASYLERKLLVSLVHMSARQRFRADLGRLPLSDGRTTVSFVLQRRKDVPLRVAATVGPFVDEPLQPPTQFLWVLNASEDMTSVGSVPDQG